ncbi:MULTISPECIES: hypothetical protein [Nostocales]|uniref:hypothetical protein n=1 Tax=Nostocales TaxID=1161 RepID=UPI0016893A92|nr:MULTISPECIES: hypothetical protein [Nostocales]MBD2302573.1 hypothetical protein [Nostoc sp. FACHB-190]MBD2492228.1 hypothetical protein [Aulosira sp. FACHB-615]
MTYTTDTQQAPISFNRTPIDEQAAAQAELYSHLEAQTQAVAPEEYTSIEISFYDHEIYFNGQLIAKITYDSNDFVTQPWLVLVNGKEEFRANAWAKCYRYICTHHKNGSLPVQEPETPVTTTGNEIMVQIAQACENFGLELLDDGIYRGDEKLGEAGCTDGQWWFIRASEGNQEQVLCDSEMDAVYWLSMVDSVTLPEIDDYDHLLDLPFDQLTSVQWERLQEYESMLELVAA